MEKKMRNSLHRMILCMAGCILCGSIGAVPAYRGWQTRTMTDGSTVTVRQNGDEFYHYWETADGKLAIEQADGSFVISEKERPTPAEVRMRRNSAKVHRMREREAVGEPNLAPKGIVILVNFSDCAMNSSHKRTTFDNMCNSTNCTTNRYEGVNYGSAAQYFSDQSNGAYRPQFDVFGPVTLPHPVAYYGEQGMKDYGDEEREENDLYMADFVIDAVLAAENAGCDFSQYDSDGDDWVDFVYFIYAGKGQAAGGTSETIWPHNWSLLSALYWDFTHGTSGYYYYNNNYNNLLQVDGKWVNNYACSAELDYNGNLGGIGTLCHEFGHVIGLPDLYDTEYGANYENHLTPNDWNIMDAGSYNGDGHCPPNYDPWEKYFFGWVTPVNPGNKSANCTLNANGTADYNVYQINASGSLKSATTSGWNYYLENRQQSGWDTYIPSHGMVIWKVNYDADIWSSNTPNNAENDLRMTVVCSSGTMVGVVWEYNEYTGRYDLVNDGSNNVFGPASGVTQWKGVYDKPVTDIKESNGVVTFKYKGGAEDQEEDARWYYYDNNQWDDEIGRSGGQFYWGIMIPAGTVQGTNPYLTHIAIAEQAEYNTQPIDIAIHRGGSYPMNITKVHTQTVQPEAPVNVAWHTIQLSEPVAVQKNKNLWIILSEGTDTYPALVCNDTGDANGRWVSSDGAEWHDLAEYDLNYTFLLRAYIQDIPNGGQNEDIEIVNSEELRDKSQKILYNGQIFILRDGKIYDIMGRMKE